IMRSSSATGHHHGTSFVCLATTEKQICNVGLNLNNFLGDHAMRFAMDLHCGFGAWCFAKAKDFTSFLIDPVLVVMNAILALHFDIMCVSLGNIICTNASRNFVNIDVCWHRNSKRRATYPEVS